MLKKLLMLASFLLAIGVIVILYDDYLVKSERKGVGFEIKPDAIFICKTPTDIDVNKLKSGDTFYLNVENSSETGSVKESSPLPNSKLKASVVAVGNSSTIKGERIAIFKVTRIVIGSSEFDFNGYISSDPTRPHDSLTNDARFLGSFAGMEGGAAGIVGGFLLGEKAIATFRRHTESPFSFIIAPGINSETYIPIRAYKPVFIPLGVEIPNKESQKTWWEKLKKFARCEQTLKQCTK